MSDEAPRSDGEGPWWTISNLSLLAMLRRAHAGEDPDLVLAEEYANSDHEYPRRDF